MTSLKEFHLLFTLANYPNHVLTRRQLIEQVWGMNYEKDERKVDVHIKRLRSRVRALTSSIRFVSMRGVSYRLEVES
ncbi:winged helix-turn-helix domain-containing protein [Paenibacillus roseipurpureus]|uniref:Winged helix-turn-helix domain-containing protein n=1 Tax=Paenibacillus roseopurpureus TaxID=2918901 RepID=A0AA96LTM1_9BACL|nr:winged helix-turn-helix domain-containing protein [Paenibacillus sp. MBLB1832]WNR44455.1 winged helix-turn-helix domain-containing protein [Paenibacillus sp. MBLB1832]